MSELILQKIYESFWQDKQNCPLYIVGCRAFHKLLEIFQIFFCNFSKKVFKSCFLKRKLLETWQNENFLWSDAKICKLYCKNKISKHFLAIWRRNQRCWITLSSIITQKCNEPIQLLKDLLQPIHLSQSSVNLRPLFWIFPKNRSPSRPATVILRPWSTPGGRIWLLFYRKFINCPLKHCEKLLRCLRIEDN